MRFVVLLFGFLGVVMTAAGGLAIMLMDEFFTALRDNEIKVPVLPYDNPTGVTTGNAGLFLFLAAFYGLIGVLMAFFRCGKQGGMLILIPVLATAFMNPFSLPFTALLLLTSLMCLFIGPLPINAPKKGKDDDEDEDDDD